MRARYESWYLRAVDPHAPRGVWIRHTTLQRAGGPPVRSLWCTVWDAAAGAPVTVKATPGECGPFAPDAFRGSASAGPHHATWDLVMTATAPPLRHLPAKLLYAAPLPRTKLQSPAPAATVSGRVEAGDRQLELDDWPGMVGHNWGAQHAERWIWLHGIGFEDADAWLDLAAGRIRIGPATTPWIANGGIHVDGGRRTLRGRPEVHAGPGEATLVLGDVRIRVTAPREQTVAWVYADPPGGEHHALNCSIAAVELSTPTRTLTTAHGGAYELGVREHDHGILLAPFPDP